MTIPDEAVQAAIDTLDADDTYVGEVDHCGQFIIDGPVNIKSMLTAALPFLQGVKADPWGWVIPRGGSKKPIILEASKFDQASAAAEADIHDLGYFPIYTQHAPAPSPRAQALEKAARIAEAYIGGEHEAQGRAAEEIASELRALSSQPVVDGWLPIETAPKDGTVIQAWHQVHRCPVSVLWKDDGFPYRGKRLNWYERTYTTAWPEHVFSHWRRLPSEPDSEGAE